MPRGRRSGRGPDYDWEVLAGLATGVDVATGTKFLWGATTGETNLEAGTALTLMRMRGRCFAQLDATAVDERVIVSVGAIVASADAIAAGTGSLPGPDSDGDDEWIWHGNLLLSSGAEAAVNTNSLFDRLEIDSKAMRKLKQNQAIVLVGEVAFSLDQGGTFDFMYGARFLTAA